jgi:hypothetical protein
MYLKKSVFLCVLFLFGHLSFAQLSFKDPYTPQNNFILTGLSSGNLDGNPLVDLVYLNSSERKIEVMYNPGSATPSSQTITVNTSGTLGFLQLADFNNDSKTDFFTINFNYDGNLGTQIIILLSNGSSFSQNVIPVSQSYYNWFPKVIDFDKDGYLDILLGNTQVMNFYKGDGSGNFIISSLSGLPQNWDVFEIADFNLDNQNDLVIISMDTLFVSLSNPGGNGYTTKKYPHTSPLFPFKLTVGDFSSDGYPDIVMAAISLSNGKTFLSGYDNDRQGKLGTPFTIKTIPGGIGDTNHDRSIVDKCDYNNDGRLDLVAGTLNYGVDFNLLMNMGNDKWADKSPSSYVDKFTSSIIFADIDNDGLAEVIELGYFQYLIFYKQVSGNYQFLKKISLGATAANGHVSDLNKDNIQDILVASPTGGTVSVFYGKGDNKFNEPIFFNEGEESINTAISADFNGDGFQDIIYSTINSSNQVLTAVLSDQTATISQKKIISHFANQQLVAGDFNSDGIMDFAGTQGIFINDGAANFTLKVFTLGVYPVNITIGNFDSNNSLDITFNDGAANYIGLNDGQGNFKSFTKVISNENVYKVKSVFMNSDNLSDLVSLHSNNDGFSIFINQGNGSFSEKTVSAQSNSGLFGYADADDINFDGLKDVVVGVSSSVPKQLFGVAVFLQDQNGNFNFFQNVGYKSGADGSNSVPDFVEITDIDSDNKKDIVCYKMNGDPIEVILNDFVSEPTQSSQSLKLTSLTGQTAAFSMQKGNGNARIAVMRETATKKAIPSDGVFYSSNPKFGIGAQIGTSNYVVLRADSTALHVTGLKEGTAYTLTVYEYSSNSSNTVINYLISSSDSISFTTKKPQTISIQSVTDKTVGDKPFILNATSSSGLSVSYSLLSGGVTIIKDTVKIVSAGPVKITVKQDGDDTYLPASQKEIDFCINPKTPEITISIQSSGKYLLTSSSSSNNQWFFNGQPITNATQTNFEPADNGVYSVKVDFSGCSAVSLSSPYLVTGIENNKYELQIFPNPFSNSANIQVPEGEVVKEISISDLTGKSSAISFYTSEKQKTINMAEFKAGMYVFKILTQNSSYFVKAVKVD